MTKEEAEYWFNEGFNHSGEGYNGEYLHKDDWSRVDEHFEKLWAKEKAPAPEGTEAPIVVDSQLELPGIR